MAIRKKGDLAAVATVPLIMTLGNSMLIPVLPSFQSKLGITALQSSLVITVYSVVAIVFIPLAGYLSDRFGRKKVIIPSLALAGLGGLISGLAVWLLQNGSAYVPLLAGRLIQGIGAAGAFPIAIPLIGDMFEREDEVSKGLGLVETANTFGKVLSPILGSLLAAWYLYAPLLSVPLLCAASVIMVWLMVKVPEDKGGRQEKPPAFRSFVREVMRLLREKGRWVTRYSPSERSACSRCLPCWSICPMSWSIPTALMAS